MPGEQEEEEQEQFDPSYDLSAVAAGKKGGGRKKWEKNRKNDFLLVMISSITK